MKIRKIEANHFKSLRGFSLEMEGFTCLIGPNCAGKSTILQFVSFLVQLVRGDLVGWLERRSWQKEELFYSGSLGARLVDSEQIEEIKRAAEEQIEEIKRIAGEQPKAFPPTLLPEQLISFGVEIENESKECFCWRGKFDLPRLACTEETIQTPSATLRMREGKLSIQSNVESIHLETDVVFSFQGSVLSQIPEERLPSSIRDLKDFLTSIQTIDLLDLESLRRHDEKSESSGAARRNLPQLLEELGKDKREQITQQLKQAFSHVSGLRVVVSHAEKKHFLLEEEYGEEKFETEARQISDGMLRIIAILAELQSDAKVLLFDEIENGISPEIMDFLMGVLQSSPIQLITTTHSPLILNYLDDDIARASVVYVYKAGEGKTKVRLFFGIPSMAKKLDFMGPGEVFADTALSQLSQELESSAR